MSFFQRVFSYVFNEVLVNTLANSRTFQRFAIRSNEYMTELAKKSADQKARLARQAEEYQKTFRDELKKGIDEQFKNQQQQGKR